MVEEIKKKTSVIKLKKEFWGSLKLKFRSLFLKIKNTGRKKEFPLIYWERVTSLVSEIHLRVPVETQQVRKVDLNWTCLFCSHGHKTVRLRTGPISGIVFRTARFLDY